MMTLAANKQKLYYALQSDVSFPVYDYYIDGEGNKHPIDTGETYYPYPEAILFYGNIAMSGGDVQNTEYGLDISSYEAVLIVGKGELPINETSLIWAETEPKIKDDGTVDSFTADYRIVKISPSLNFDKYILAKVIK